MSRRVGLGMSVVVVAVVSGVAIGVPGPTAVGAAPAGQHTGRVWASISAGAEHSCGIRVDGSLWCWGSNGSGQLGTGGTPGVAWAPVRVGEASWVQVDASDFAHTCGIQTDGSLWCWGYNDSGQLGTGDRASRSVPARVEGDALWSAVSTGYGHTCGIRVDGSMWCWGLNNGGQLGTGSDAYEVLDPGEVGTLGSGTRWVSVTAGGYYTCGVQADHSLWCWGGGGYGELGLGDRQSRYEPARVGGHADWVQVSAGYDFTCGVRAAHTLWCWGYNYNGELGVGDRTNRYVPTRVAGRFWAQVSNGGSHACGLSTDGALFCWGAGHHGDLGYGGTTDMLNPLRVGTRSDWMLPAAGGGFTCALRITHGLLCWGWNLYGQLGIDQQVKRALYPRVV